LPLLEPITDVPPADDRGKRAWVYTLGRFLVVRDAGNGTQPAPVGAAFWRQHRTQQVLKCVIAMPAGHTRADEVAYLLWPEERPADRIILLRRAVKALRRLLGENAAPALANGELVLPAAPHRRLWVDADAFVANVAAARALPPAPASRQIHAYEMALRLYAGDFLPDDHAASWSYQRREALRYLWLAAGCELADLLVLHGRPAEAIPLLGRLHEADPAREEIARRLAVLLARRGERLAARAALRSTQEALWQARADRGSAALQAMAAALEHGETPPYPATPATPETARPIPGHPT